MTDRRRHRALRALSASAVALTIAVGPVACSDSATDTDAFCAAVEVAPSLRSVFVGFTDRSPADLDRSLDQASAAYHRVRDNAPAAIRPEAEEIVEVVDVIISAVADNPDDNEAAAAAIQRETDRVPSLEASTKAFAEFVAEECDLELNPADDQPTDGQPTTTPATASDP